MVKCYKVERGRYSGQLKGGRMGYNARKKSMGKIRMKPAIQFRKVFFANAFVWSMGIYFQVYSLFTLTKTNAQVFL